MLAWSYSHFFCLSFCLANWIWICSFQETGNCQTSLFLQIFFSLLTSILSLWDSNYTYIGQLSVVPQLAVDLLIYFISAILLFVLHFGEFLLPSHLLTFSSVLSQLVLIPSAYFSSLEVWLGLPYLLFPYHTPIFLCLLEQMGNILYILRIW